MGIRFLVPEGIKQNIANALGWKTDRKIVVLESDDWGSIRMPSKSAWESLRRQGVRVDDPYNRLDSLETGADLSALCEVLTSFMDGNGRPPLLTTNYLVANPDFAKIEQARFEEYHYELLTETYRKTPGCANSWNVLQEGMAAGVLRPQLHGREHLNVPLWMVALREGIADTRLAFAHGCWGHVTEFPAAKRKSFLVACDYNSQVEAELVYQIVVDGARQFQSIFGFNSKTFIAPKYIWDDNVSAVLSREGVKALQGHRNQLLPKTCSARYGKCFHYSGQTNGFGQYFLVRNALFEPVADTSRDWVASCLKEIDNAFKWKTPAIVSTHRVNFMGTLESKNRSSNLAGLHQLLSEILKRWPDVEFLSSDDFADCIAKLN